MAQALKRDLVSPIRIAYVGPEGFSLAFHDSLGLPVIVSTFSSLAEVVDPSVSPFPIIIVRGKEVLAQAVAFRKLEVHDQHRKSVFVYISPKEELSGLIRDADLSYDEWLDEDILDKFLESKLRRIITTRIQANTDQKPENARELSFRYEALKGTFEILENPSQLLELKPSDQLSMDELVKLVAEEDRGTLSYFLDNCLKYAESAAFLARLDSKDDTTHQVEVHLTPKKGGEGAVLEGVIKTYQSSGPERSLFLQMDDQLHLYRHIVNELNIVAITDRRGIITHVNELFCKISKYSPEELIGKTHSLLKSGYHPQEFYTNLWKTIASGKSWYGEIKNRDKEGGYYWVRTFIKPLFNRDLRINGYLAVRTDITKEKEQLEIDLKTNRLAAVGETTAQIIHDIINPLQIIKGNATILEQRKDLFQEEQMYAVVQNISKAVDRVEAIFHGLRGSIVDRYRTSQVNLMEVIANAIMMSKSALDKYQIQVNFDLPGDLCVLGNEDQLAQVFLNLIRNSVDAIQSLEDRWLFISAETQYDKILIRFTDSGEGIPEELHDKIFESLFSTKLERGGTGLGLGIVKKIIGAHGGTIEVNQSAQNTQFVITLPLSQA